MTRDDRSNPAPSVSVCFPAYNEEAGIRDVLEEAHALLSESGVDYEIIVCNDGSRDRTKAIIEEVQARTPRLRLLDHQRNQGIRATFEHLYSEATKDFVFLNSTDGQWRTAILFDMLPEAAEFDIIVASRRHKHYTAWRKVISRVFNAVPLVLFGVRTHDAGAVKLMRREIITRFKLVARSPFSEAERMIRAARAGYRIKKMPVESFARKAGLARGAAPRVLLQALIDIPRVWWSIHFGRDSKSPVAADSPR